MSENVTLGDLVKNSVYRRTWLLYEAVKTAHISDALALARAADEFITGALIVQSGADCSMQPAIGLPGGDKPTLDTAIDAVETTTTPLNARGDRIQLPTNQRERLIERLSSGATNPDLASEFGLSGKQVQGLRLGLARKGAERRTGFEEKPQPAEEVRLTCSLCGSAFLSRRSHARFCSVACKQKAYRQRDSVVGLAEDAQPTEEMGSTSADEIVRYLRQQDDVVVRNGEGGYLINGRFQLSLPDLISRANKMRNRQGKPAFKFANIYMVKSEDSILPNGQSSF